MIIERKGDIRELWGNPTILLCCTTNSVVKKNGELVMGAGVAKAFAEYDPSLPLKAGIIVSSALEDSYVIDTYGLIIIEGKNNQPIGLFQTKIHYSSPSSLSTIFYSLRRLREVLLRQDCSYDAVHLPFPGIGMGQLDTDDVMPFIQETLNDLVIPIFLWRR